MIPKVIYYCWFGHNQKSKEIEMCMESWRKVCPEQGWKIVEINETNFDINFCNFTREAYAQKKWAFVSDVARLWAIYTYGGYYLDTDVELLEPLDRFLPYDCWVASNDVNFIATGLGFGAVAGHWLVGQLLEDYKDIPFEGNVCVQLNTATIRKCLPDFQPTADTLVIENVLFLGMKDTGKVIHHLYLASWVEDNLRSHMKKRAKKKWLWALKCKVRSPKIINYLSKRKGKGSQIYTFFAYDFLDLGLVYWGKKAGKKLKAALHLGH